MVRRTLAALLILFGLFAVGGVLYKERFSLHLMLFGEHASGVIVKALAVDEQNLSHSRYNLDFRTRNRLHLQSDREI